MQLRSSSFVACVRRLQRCRRHSLIFFAHIIYEWTKRHSFRVQLFFLSSSIRTIAKAENVIKCGWVYEDNGIYYMSVGFIVTNCKSKKNFRLLMIWVFYCVGTSIDWVAFMSRALELCNSFRGIYLFGSAKAIFFSGSIRAIRFFLVHFFQKIFHWMLMKMNLDSRVQQWAIFSLQKSTHQNQAPDGNA